MQNSLYIPNSSRNNARKLDYYNPARNTGTIFEYYDTKFYKELKMVDVWYTAGTPVSIPPKKDYHFQYKIVLVGDPSVGKSSFVKRYIQGENRRNTLPKIEEDDDETETCPVNKFHLDQTEKIINRLDKIVKLTIWDTAG